MNHKIIIEIDPQHEAIVRRALALSEEMQQLALAAPDGFVFDQCEQAVIAQGRKLQQQLLAEAVARRIETAEKRGRRSASVPVAGKKKTAAKKNANL